MDETTVDAVPEPARPVLRVVRGATDREDLAVELAALVAVLAARGGGEDVPTAPPSAWSDPRRRLRQPVYPSLGGWRTSGLPR